MAHDKKAKRAEKGPDSAQLRAIERLLADERFEDALERSARLADVFPGHSGVRGLYIESMLASGHPDQAAEVALDWMQQHPNSARAARLSVVACLESGLPNLALSAVEHLTTLGEVEADLERDARADARDARKRMGDVDFDTALRVEKGLLLCFLGRNVDAGVALAGIDVPVGLHALALTRFQSSAVESAFDTIWPLVERRDAFPAALLSAAQYCLYLGQHDRVGYLRDRMIALVPSSPVELLHQISGLLLLDHPAEAARVFERAPNGLFEDGGETVLSGLWNAAGVAYARSGDWGTAQRLFRQAVDADASDLNAKANLEAAQDRQAGEAVAVQSMQDWFPEASLRKIVEALADLFEQGIDPRVDPELLELDALPERSSYLAVIARQADAAIRTVAREVLRRRAEDGEPEAVDALRALIVDSDGPDFERLAAGAALYFAGELPRVGTVEIFLAGRLRQLQVKVPWISHEAWLPGMDEEQRVAFIEAEELVGQGDGREACAAFARILAHATTRAAQLAVRHELAV
ncbi:MAG TPA: tetratricopeptide repeat protein, partial [Burkholderiales bacterium]|nr:tetratricopeptide repeat protein [Burkholderiales bacterium]